MEAYGPLKVGLAGCGYQGELLAEAIDDVETMTLVACVDPDLPAAMHLAARHSHVAVFPSVNDMLSQADVDAVLVATPHHLLCEVALPAVRAGKHVLVEKPVGLDAQEVIGLEDAVTAAGVCGYAGYSLRSVNSVALVKQQIAAGAVGEIQAIAGIIGAGSMNGSWAANPETGGGPLLYLGTHLLDLVLWYLEDTAIDVFADIRMRPDTGADQTSAFLVRFARGAIAQCVVTQAADSFFHSMDIVGTQGHVRIWSQGFLNYAVEVVNHAQEYGRHPTTIRPYVLIDGRRAMLVSELHAFAQAIRQHAPPAVSMREARNILEIIDAVRVSSASGRVAPVSQEEVRLFG